MDYWCNTVALSTYVTLSNNGVSLIEIDVWSFIIHIF